jgi:hypothetical protein
MSDITCMSLVCEWKANRYRISVFSPLFEIDYFLFLDRYYLQQQPTSFKFGLNFCCSLVVYSGKQPSICSLQITGLNIMLFVRTLDLFVNHITSL